MRLAAGLVAASAEAQVTSIADDVDNPTSGSLRFEIENASPGDTIAIEIPDSETASTIPLAGTLVFDQSLALDNANTDFRSMPIVAPDQGAFLELGDGVNLILRDVTLTGDGTRTDDVIDLTTATSVLTVDLERADQTIAVDFVGNGRLVKQGTRALTLTGVNVNAGGIRIEEGDVVGDLDALARGGDVTLAPVGRTARVVFDLAGTGNLLDANGPAFLSAASNGGRAVFVKRGTGDLDLTGGLLAGAANIDAAIDLEVEAGDLIIGSSLLVAGRDLVIDAGGTLHTTSAPADYAGAISGAGRLSHESFDTLRLTGDLSAFSGALGIQAGSIVQIAPTLTSRETFAFSVDSAAGLLPLPGVLSVSNPSAFDLTLSGRLSGELRLRMDGGGVVRLAGQATHTGGTYVDDGTLVGDTGNLQREIVVAAGSALHFDQSADGTFSGAIHSDAGAISVRKIGTGILTLGTTQDFAGVFQHDDGGLVFAGGVALSNAGLVVGDGDSSVADLSADFDAAGAQAANTVSIGGDLTIQDDARIAVVLSDQDENGNPAHRSTRYAATGAVTIGGGSPGRSPELVVHLQPGTYTGVGLGPYTVITGASVTQNEAFTLQDDLLFFDLSGGVAGNAYQVNLVASDASLASEASTHNQREVGGALDVLRAAGEAGDPDLQAILENLNTITSAEVGPTLDAFSGDTLSAATNVRLAAAARTWRSISNRLDLARGRSIGREPVGRERGNAPLAGGLPMRSGDGMAPVDAGPDGTASMRRPEPWVAWVEAAGVDGDLGSSDAQGYGYKIVGPIFGADTALSDEVRFGFAGAGTRYVYDGDGSNDKGAANAVEGTLYGAWVGDPVELLIGARYGHSWIDTKRTLRFDDLVSRAEGEFEGNEAGAYAELAHAFGSPRRIEVTPFANATYSWVQFEDFDEDGRSALRMRVDGTDVHSAATALGLRVAVERKMDEDMVLRPRLRAAWGHEWADVVREVNGEFVAGGGSLELEGAEIPRDRAELSVGWEVGFGPGTNLYVTWDGRFGEDLVENALALGLRAAW